MSAAVLRCPLVRFHGDTRDYERIEPLDHYDADELDEEVYDPLTLDERREAERYMQDRDRELAKREGRLPGALEEGEQ